MKTDKEPKLLSFGWGLVIWGIIAFVGHHAEAWDSPLYFSAAMPLLGIGSAVIGYFYPVKAWRWFLWLALGQWVGLMVSASLAGHDLSLFPLGMVAMLFLNMPYLLTSLAGSGLYRITHKNNAPEAE